jgi:hypothetical protein
MNEDVSDDEAAAGSSVEDVPVEIDSAGPQY